MFPAKLAHYFIQRYSGPGDVVVDPFSGRGTVPLQARIEGRNVVCNDLNPLAYVLSRAKANPPSWDEVNAAVDLFEQGYKTTFSGSTDVPDDIQMLFHPNSLRQISYLRNDLLRRGLATWSPADYMIAGAMAGILHGSHRKDGTSRYLSISMPNTFSMSPTYVRKFIQENGLKAPDQNVFECLRQKLARLYLDSVEGPAGRAHNMDACKLLRSAKLKPGSVDLVVTSPPYLQVVNYGTANWIRLWWLGIEDVGRDGGSGRRSLNAQLDHQHTYETYSRFFDTMLGGIRRVLNVEGTAVVVIGDVANPGEDPLPLAKRLWDKVGADSGLKLTDLIEDHLPVQNKVSRIWGETRGNATNTDCILVLSRKDGKRASTLRSVNWDEPYKDAGPDSAHKRVNTQRRAS
jgi:site-specific DNA-methyltransferase (adenine-specific)